MSLFLATLAISASAMAQGYSSLEYYDEHNRKTGADNIKEAIVVGTKVGSTDYSIKMENSQTSFGNGSISQGLEVRVKQSFGPIYVGGRLGEKVSSTENFSHYAIDAGVKFPLVAGLTGDVGGRYMNWTFNMKQTLKRLKRMLRCRDLKVKGPVQLGVLNDE